MPTEASTSKHRSNGPRLWILGDRLLDIPLQPARFPRARTTAWACKPKQHILAETGVRIRDPSGRITSMAPCRPSRRPSGRKADGSTSDPSVPSIRRPNPRSRWNEHCNLAWSPESKRISASESSSTSRSVRTLTKHQDGPGNHLHRGCDRRTRRTKPGTPMSRMDPPPKARRKNPLRKVVRTRDTKRGDHLMHFPDHAVP